MIKSPWQMIVFLVKYPAAVFSMLARLLQCSNKIVPFYNITYPLVVIRAASLALRRGFEPNEALQLGLLEPNYPKTGLGKVISKREMVKIQKTINPLSWSTLTDNKSIFYTYCKALGLPIPELYAIFFQHSAGYSTNGSLLTSREDWQSFISTKLPSEFIIKPAEGAYGDCIKCFSRVCEEAFTDASSEKKLSAADIYDFMCSHTYYKTFVIQERLINHPDLTRLSNTEYLQTVRILTFVDKKGQSRILHAFLKPIVGKNIIDNHAHGSTGNLLAEISVDNGALKPAVKLTPNVSGIKIVSCHPVTGISFESFRVPLWDDLCRLAKETSLKFLPLRIIGWDIAITPNGLYIIEANFFADPPSFHQTGDVILSKLNVVN